jgi:PIN domain nuclease of toxin-antitoxin system
MILQYVFGIQCFLQKIGKSMLGEGSLEQILSRHLESSGLDEAPLTSEIAALSRALAFEHDEPAERFTAATAFAMDALLATSDRNLRGPSWVRLAY